MKKVIAFMGSPRKKGNTAAIVAEILKGAASAGAETKTFNLTEMDIKPCRACYYCRKHEGCAIKDDMQQIYDSLKEADAVIFGSPVYMFQVTGQVKQMMDRLYPILSGEKGVYDLRYGRKRTVTVYAQGAPDAAWFQDYFSINQKLLGFLGFDVMEQILCSGAVDMDSAATDATLMATAYAAGQKLAE